MENTLTRKKQIITAKDSHNGNRNNSVGCHTSAVPRYRYRERYRQLTRLGISADASRRILHSSFGRSRGGCRNGSGKSLLSFALTGMPSAALLPFMMIELTVYGLVCGLLKNKKCPSF